MKALIAVTSSHGSQVLPLAITRQYLMLTSATISFKILIKPHRRLAFLRQYSTCYSKMSFASIRRFHNCSLYSKGDAPGLARWYSVQQSAESLVSNLALFFEYAVLHQMQQGPY